MSKFHCKYEPGKLEAVSFDKGGMEIGRSELVTAQKKSVLRIEAEKIQLVADGQSVCFLSITISDEKGEVKPSEDIRVKVAVEGEAAALIALGSANPKTDQLFDKDEHKTYRGRALAVLRAGYQTGNVKVTVSAEGFKSQSVVVIE